METKFGNCQVQLVQGDITGENVGAIVNAANTGNVGEAKITTGGSFKSKFKLLRQLYFKF